MTRRIDTEYAQAPILGINGMRLLGLRSGVGRMIEAFLREIDDIPHPFAEILVYTPQPIDEAIYLPRRARNVVIKSPLPKGLWEQFVLPLAHGRKGPLFCPSYAAPLFAPCPVVLTHHGSYEAYPQGFSWFNRTKSRIVLSLSARSADFLSTVSKHSQGDIAKYYHVPKHRVDVIPEGVDTEVFRPIHDIDAKNQWRRKWIGSDDPYILYVGKASHRRNLNKLIEAFAILKEQHGWKHKLVFLGTKLPGDALAILNENEAAANDIIMIGYAEHDDITYAYNCADIFVYPSSYEGFGMPVLEALACGTPTITLNNTAFPEFAGGIAWLLEDAEPATMATAMLKLSVDETAKSKMREQGPVRAAEYDWCKLIPKYVDILCRASGLPPVSEKPTTRTDPDKQASTNERVV